MAPPPTETFYVGLNGGGVVGHGALIDVDPSVSPYGVSGALAGGTLGFEMPSGPWRFGIEGDIAGGLVNGQTKACFPSSRANNTFLATARGKIGYDFDPVMVYATGGLAVGDVNFKVAGLPAAGGVQPGWVAGAGARLPLTTISSGLPAGWTGKFEWLHADLGSPQICSVTTCGGVALVSYHADVLRLGIDIPLSTLLGSGTLAAAPASSQTAHAPLLSPRAMQVASLVPVLPASTAAPVQRIVVRFDKRLVALTPLGIRALAEAVAAARAGMPVQVEIRGCPAPADQDASICAQRAQSLTRLMTQRGVENPKRLLAVDRP
jgi:outer membrane immunogenic protein